MSTGNLAAETLKAGGVLNAYDNARDQLVEVSTRTRPLSEFFDGTADKEIREARMLYAGLRAEVLAEMVKVTG